MAEQKTGLIYITDDEPNIRKLVALALKEQGFETQEFSNGADLLKALQKRLPDAIVLDWIMPELDGLTVCGRLKLDKTTKIVPIILLTARNEEVDCVLGLEMGADDYIIKPFSLKELCARVKAVVRRKDFVNPSSPNDEIIGIGDLVINLAKRTITKGDQLLSLTMKEFDLLTTLIQSKGRVLTRNQLMEKVWDVEYCGDARTVDVHVRYLRQKVENEANKPKYIKTVRGMGYRCATEDEL
ncbi:MAG: response regulator transcription factor [Oscillospiraceae bacterium]|nr:response regulator transcription factor [Oscillospiraceae bacterium]